MRPSARIGAVAAIAAVILLVLLGTSVRDTAQPQTAVPTAPSQEHRPPDALLPSQLESPVATNAELPIETRAPTDRTVAEARGPRRVCSAGAADTRGKFGDEHDTGNEVDTPAADIQSIQPNATFTRFFESEPTDEVYTRVERASDDKGSPQCYYRVTNFCVKAGALVFIRLPKTALRGRELWPQTQTTASSTSGTLRLCNELRAKVNLRFFVEDSMPKGVPFSDSPAHVTACWQYYGYHLMQCAATAYVTAATHGFADGDSRRLDLWLFNHAVSLPQVSREHYSHAMYMGSKDSWNVTRARRPKYRDAPWWRIWSQATADPSHVDELFKFPVGADATGPSRCYRRGLIGHPNHNAVPGIQRRAHRQRLDALWLDAATIDANLRAVRTGTFRVLVTQRGSSGKNQGGRRILNLPEVIAALKKAFSVDASVSIAGVKRVVVETVDWAELTFEQQFNKAAQADVVVAMHGAGNSWILAQRPRTAFVEIWPQCVARNVYLVMARQYNVRYYSLCLMLPTKAAPGSPEARYGFLHHSLDVPTEKLVPVVRHALEYVVAVRKDASC